MKKPSLEQLKKDMEDKRMSAAASDAAAYAAAYAAYAAAYAAYVDAYAAYAAAYAAYVDAYWAAKKKYEKALEQAPAASSESVSISRECASRLLSLVRENKAETPYVAEFENWGSLEKQLKDALEENDDTPTM